MNKKFKELTDEIIKDLDKGCVPWRKEHGFSFWPVRFNGEDYNGINVLTLMMQAHFSSYINNKWITFKQAKSLGGCVRKGEKSSTVYYFKSLEVDDENSTDLDKKKIIPMMRAYPVFNVAQIDGLEDKFYLAEHSHKKVDDLEEFFNNIGARIEIQAVTPTCNHVTGNIKIPDIKTFDTPENYYSTLAHEFIHWTGHSKRLDRGLLSLKKSDYAFEELVAEIGAVFLCSKLNIKSEIDSNHISYISGWYKKLKNDPKLILKAASLAQKAVDYIFECYEFNSQSQPQAKAL